MDEIVRIFLLSEALVDVALDENAPKSIRVKKIEAVQTAFAINRSHEKYAFREDILETILAKRLLMIREATTIGQLNQITNPKPPHFNGAQFVPASKYSIPEEEMLGWSLASLSAPLNDSAYKRYMELFRQYFGAALLNELR